MTNCLLLILFLMMALTIALMIDARKPIRQVYEDYDERIQM